jgi:hypothetical protein
MEKETVVIAGVEYYMFHYVIFDGGGSIETQVENTSEVDEVGLADIKARAERMVEEALALAEADAEEPPRL